MKCLVEKEERGWKDLYGKEREKYYDRNGWGTCALDALRNDEVRYVETELICRERELQRQWEDRKIREARYNVRYKQIERKEGGPRYLRKECLDKGIRGEDVRALVRLKCGNLEKANKYWKEAKDWKCVFCRREEDNMKHFVEGCSEVKDWFVESGFSIKEKWSRL